MWSMTPGELEVYLRGCSERILDGRILAGIVGSVLYAVNGKSVAPMRIADPSRYESDGMASEETPLDKMRKWHDQARANAEREHAEWMESLGLQEPNLE